MILDQMLHRIPRDRVIADMRQDIIAARAAKPMPHLPYRTELSLVEQMFLREIKAEEVGTTDQELKEWERMGAALAVRSALELIQTADPILENIDYWARLVQTAIKRHQLDPSVFHLTTDTLLTHTQAYWFAQAAYAVTSWSKTQDRSLEMHILSLLTLRTTLLKTRYKLNDFGVEYWEYAKEIRWVHQQLVELYKAIRPDDSSIENRTRTNRYTTLCLIASPLFQDIKR